MMKKYLLKIVGLLFLCGMVFSCEKDNFVEEHQNLDQQNGITIKVIHKKEISTNENLMKILQKLKESQNNSLLGRGGDIYNEEYGFTIHTDVVKYIENSTTNRHFYNFHISKDKPDDAFLENLVFQSNGIGGYNAYIVHYGFTSNEFKSMDQNELETSSTVIVPIDFDYNVVLKDNEMGKGTETGRVEYNCIFVWSVECGVIVDEGEVDGENNVGCQWTLMAQSCGPSGGNSGGGDTGGNGGTGEGGGGANGGGDNNDDPPPVDCHGPNCGMEIIAVPVLPVENDCQDLKTLSDVNGQNINDQIDFLKTKLDEQNSSTNPHEWGVMFKRELNGDGSHTYTNTPVEGTAHGVNLIKGWDYIGGAHIHTLNGYGMYSFGDLVQLAGFYDYASADNLPYVVSIMICNNPAYETDPTANPYIVYALKANNPSLLISRVNNMLNSPLYEDSTREKTIENILWAQRAGYKAHKNNLEKYFLQVFGTFGVDLYKATGDMSNWSKLSLNGTTVESIPCN
ncbi:MAG TPA: hypothetical protein VFM65_02610 [Flavobacteriaceae bacterium]|nr:hypothetical protein [Flavobacteriaceae bacterium]